MDADRLRALPPFVALDAQTLKRVATFAGERSVPAGTRVVTEGDYAHELMIIEEGAAEVVRGGETIATLGPGDVFGEIGVLEKTLRTASVLATTPMRLVTLTHWDLKRIGDAIEQIRATLAERKHSLG
jgi:CRP-like cAMP-binding protein